MKLQQAALEVQLTPVNMLLRAVLSQLQEKDQYGIFAQPVSAKEVPDYLEHIAEPMDFSTMRRRVDGHAYGGLEELEADFDLVIANCMKYNAKDTFFYRAAQRMQDHGGAILRRARREAARIGFDFPGGLHLPEAPPPEAPPPFSWEDVDRLLSPAYRRLTPLEEQLRALLEALDLSGAMKPSPSRSKRLKLLKKSITEVRGELSLRRDARGRRHATPPPGGSEEPPPGPAPPEEEMLELLTSLSRIDASPPPEAGKLGAADRSPSRLHSDSSTSPDAATHNVHAACNRRSGVLFRKSKSASPQKPLRSHEAAPPLGAKTFLSVRQNRQNRRVTPPPLSSGIANGFVVEEEGAAPSPRLLEPRRRCASESSISSGGSVLTR
ncbi:Bromodomain-containing protein 1 [Liparis tanakae]|uniref:Bromodomain-containing protein 1 n=1 Tax=Liparis tanakae TaxID=230148 RepID=A0A4Z2EAU8_9TELE|nr:Bromodomain-containing protein 1 [Liparis tanakae]